LTARANADEVNGSSPRSISELVNGTYVAVTPTSSSSSSSSFFYVDDPVRIVYAVGKYIDAFSYRLLVGSGADVQQISLTEFESAIWPSTVPIGAVGGDIVHRFRQAGVYRVVFVVSGVTTHNGTEESTQVETSVTMSARPTLQVQRINNCETAAAQVGCRSSFLNPHARMSDPTEN